MKEWCNSPTVLALQLREFEFLLKNGWTNQYSIWSLGMQGMQWVQFHLKNMMKQWKISKFKWKFGYSKNQFVVHHTCIVLKIPYQNIEFA